MIIIGDVIVSEVLLERKFVCDLNACKGACCVEGDEGAPVREEEVEEIKNNIPGILSLLDPDAIRTIEENGPVHQTSRGLRTTLRKDGACVFTVFDEKGIATCGIEKAWSEGRSNFRKPLSCHLYPARETPLEGAVALNYEEWEICSPACQLGEALKIPVYRFLKEALIRAYGEEFYKALDGYAQKSELG